MIKLSEHDKAPRFALPDTSGAKVALADFKGQWLVLYFYPKDMTPGCTVQAQDFSVAFAKFKKAKAQVLGVSKDSVERHQKFTKKEGIKFQLLADEDAKVSEAYGVFKEKNLYGHKFMGIERTTFIINPQGAIARIYPKVKVKGHVESVLADLKDLAAK